MDDRRTYLWIEFAAIFVLLPGLLAVLRQVLIRTEPTSWPRGIVPALLLATASLVFVYLMRDGTFDRRRLIRLRGLAEHLKPVALRFAVLGPLMVVILWRMHPEGLFMFPRAAPGVWAFVMVGYPLASVTPQGVIWRAFLMHRYAGLFPRWPVMWLVAAAAFAWVHIFFFNVAALVLTFIGGLMFVHTYRRSGSLVPSIIEHALYGCWAFTVGYGRFLYGGHVSFQS